MNANPALAYASVARADPMSRVREFAPLVRRLARHLASRLPASVEIDDIIQAGMMGLMDAANRFEESYAAQFETFASQRIRGAMLDELRKNDWLPRSTRRSLRQIEDAVRQLEQHFGRPPSEAEIAARLQMTLPEYQTVLQEAKGYELIHIDDFGDDGFLDHHCPDGAPDPLQGLVDARFRTSLVKAIEQLPEREKLVMSLYYEQDLNFKEIAAVLDVTESRVCQIHSQVIARLRAKMRDW